MCYPSKNAGEQGIQIRLMGHLAVVAKYKQSVGG